MEPLSFIFLSSALSEKTKIEQEEICVKLEENPHPKFQNFLWLSDLYVNFKVYF